MLDNYEDPDEAGDGGGAEADALPEDDDFAALEAMLGM